MFPPKNIKCKSLPDANTADRMKDACTNYFGTAGPAFVEAIINDDIYNVREQLKQLDQVAEHIGDAKTNEEKRVRKRFALAGFAGEMAINSGVLPWPQGRAMESTKTVFALWRQDNVAVSDAERGIANVVSFILKHGPSRFDREDGHIVRDRVGIYRDGYYHFFTEAFPEACGGVLPKTVKRALRDRLTRSPNTSEKPRRMKKSGYANDLPSSVSPARWL